MQPENYEIQKIFNNNVVLAKQHDKERILIKKGIGFGKKTGDILDSSTHVDKVFILQQGETTNKFKQLITRIDDNLIGICEEVIYMISSEINEPIDDEIHLRLIDHIAFTLYRIIEKDKIQNPFIVEVETLYPREMYVAEKAVKMLEKSTGISIPDDEVAFIALHIHSAINKGNFSKTIKYAYICSSAIELVEDELNIEIPKKSIDYARFVSHIRFALERAQKNKEVKNDLLPAIMSTYKSSFAIAEKIAALISEQTGIMVSKEEIGYITMHIERLKFTSDGELY